MTRFQTIGCAAAAVILFSPAWANAQSILDPSETVQHVVIQTAQVDALGTYLTDQEGRAVYMFTVEKAGKPECDGPCAKDWAPVTTRSDATAGDGAKESMVGTVSTGTAARQVTYAGQPLYYFIHDGGKAGATTGQAVASYSGFWYLLSPDGEPITAKRPGEFPAPQNKDAR